MKKLFYACFRAGAIDNTAQMQHYFSLCDACIWSTKKDLILRELVKEPVPELGYTATVISALHSSLDGHFSLVLQCIITTSRGQIH